MGKLEKTVKSVVSNPLQAITKNPFGGVIGQSGFFAQEVAPQAAKMLGGLGTKPPSNPYNVSGDEAALTAQFLSKAQGNGPFLADKKAEQDMANSQAQAMSMASSMRGVSPAAAARMAFSSANQQNAQIGAQAALNRATEQQQNEMNAFRALESQRQGAQAASGLNAQLKAQANAANQAMFGNLLGSAGAAAMPLIFASDENVKTDIKDGSKSIRNFLDSLNAHNYKYVSKTYGEEGQHTSVMAQELEKSEIGKKMVKDTPIGKFVDYSKGVPAMLAAQADLHKRLKAIEEKSETPQIQKFYKGGKVQKMATGGYVPQDPGSADPQFYRNFLNSLQQLTTPQGAGAGMSKLGDAMGTVIGQKVAASMNGPTQPVPNLGGGSNMAMQPMARPYAEGGYVVPGKASVEGDSEDNDTVPAILSPGEIVIPRSVAKKSPKDVAKFVAAIQKKESKSA